MYIRIKKNKSGSSSVFIVDKSRGEYRVVKNFGVGRTEEEIELLEQRARKYLLEATGLSQSLFEKKPDVLVSYLSHEQLRLIGPELIYGRLYDKVGFGRLQNEMFRHLVISHLLSPNSKVKAIDYLQRFIGKNHGVLSIYRFLDNLYFNQTKKNVVAGKEIRRETGKIAFIHTRKVIDEPMKPLFCHLMPLRFEVIEAKTLHATFSKNSKHKIPQLYLCLLTDSCCNPIAYDLFEENALQDNLFIHSIRRLSKSFDLSRPIVLADAGLLSKNSISALENERYEYMLDVELKNETEDIRQSILNLALKDGNMTEISKDETCRLIVSKSAERAAMDRLKRERGLKRLQQKIKSGRLSHENINNRGFNKYLKLKGKTKIIIDNDKCRMDAVWDGITGYMTNSKLRADEIMENHNNCSFIKQAFRMNKADLLIRPVYHGIQNRIEALICICFAAYTIMLELDRQLKTAGSTILLTKAQEIIYTLYQLANSKEKKKHIQHMDKQQAELCRIVENAVIM